MKKSWILPLAFAALGGLAGYLYYYFFGCRGSCPITSSPWLTTIYTAVVGYLIYGVVRKEKT